MPGAPPRQIAAVLLPRLVLEAHRATTEKTVIVVDDGDGDRPFHLRNTTRIVDCTDDLRAVGIAPPQRVMDAQKIAPSLRVQVMPRAFADETLTSLAELCLSFSPIVEPVVGTGLPHILLDLTGIPLPCAAQAERLKELFTRMGHRAVLGIAPGRRLALAWARERMRRIGAGTAPGDVELLPHAIPARLPTFSIFSIGLSPELAEQLADLGVHTAGDLARLKRARLSARLQGEAKRTLDFLAGHDRAPLRALRPPAQMRERIDLDFSITALEPLLFLLGPLCQRLCARLMIRQAALSVIELVFHLVTGSEARAEADPNDGLSTQSVKAKPMQIAFPEPINDPRALVRAIAARLERTGLPGEVHRVDLNVAREARVTMRQGRMAFGAGDSGQDLESDRALASLLAELSEELGAARVGCLTSCSTLRPEQMSQKVWPPRDGDDLAMQARSGGGRFWALWPWPLTLSPSPQPSPSLDADRRDLFCRIEGEDARDVPLLRVYEVWTLRDGRRALVLIDEETEEEHVAGWFD